MNKEISLPIKSGTKAASPSGKRKKIMFVDGLGVDPLTREFIAHFRLGNKTYTLSTGKRNREEAEKWLKNEKASLRDYQESGAIKGLTFAEGLEFWASKAPLDFSRKRRPGQSTIETVKEDWKNWLLPEFGHLAIESASRDLLTRCVERYHETPGPYGPHTLGGIRSLIINISSPIRFLKRQGYIRNHPALPVIPEMDEPKINYIASDRIEDVLELFDRYVGYDIYAMIYIRTMGLSGLRTENARSLRKEYFNLEDGTFSTGITKNGKDYILPIPQALRELLQRVPDIEKAGPLFEDSGKGGDRGYGWCIKHFKRACKALGLPNTRAWHTLRATYATNLIRSHVDLPRVKKLMTHETLVMILRYAGCDQTDLAEAQSQGMQFMSESRNKRNRR